MQVKIENLYLCLYLYLTLGRKNMHADNDLLRTVVCDELETGVLIRWIRDRSLNQFTVYDLNSRNIQPRFIFLLYKTYRNIWYKVHIPLTHLLIEKRCSTKLIYMHRTNCWKATMANFESRNDSVFRTKSECAVIINWFRKLYKKIRIWKMVQLYLSDRTNDSKVIWLWCQKKDKSKWIFYFLRGLLPYILIEAYRNMDR